MHIKHGFFSLFGYLHLESTGLKGPISRVEYVLVLIYHGFLFSVTAPRHSIGHADSIFCCQKGCQCDMRFGPRWIQTKFGVVSIWGRNFFLKSTPFTSVQKKCHAPSHAFYCIRECQEKAYKYPKIMTNMLNINNNKHVCT